MKNIFYSIITLSLILLLGACNKWLDVQPSNEFSEDNQFSTEQGFVDALTGVYQKLTSTSIYGTNLSFGFVDVLAQQYQNKSAQTTDYYGEAAYYNYESEELSGQLNVKQTIANIWSNQYNAIANLNYILKNIEERGSVLTSENAFNIVKGEALALRAFLHFDLLRLYAPAYLDGVNAGRIAIPYVTTYSVTPTQSLTVEEVVKLILADLSEAESLLSVSPGLDRIADNQGDTSLKGTWALFMTYRQNHLNYWAVKSLLARVYLYVGDKDNALYYAEEVINNASVSFVTTTAINTDATSESSDITFTNEHLFSLYVTGMDALANNYFKSGTTTTAESSDLYTTLTILSSLYEQNASGYGQDIRSLTAAQNRWSQLTESIVYTKKYYADNSANVKQRLIPLIRLPEVYYIAAEASPTVSEGLSYLNAVRTSRLIPMLTETDVRTTEELNAAIAIEYRKEFYAEGQLWYYFKRKNILSIPNSPSSNVMTESMYVLPLPDDELEFNPGAE
ncbi:RagB/SusD family nutrient uptake outer membrane protein [Sphingobacterium sp. LRF_L2]|uniref:RagB/SusD family nutrient uptake outer membrane protein n=1 Tax=Sphingobacterium sp. LRF_L2 TaxID=3369421 RepID=UPI003F604BCE